MVPYLFIKARTRSHANVSTSLLFVLMSPDRSAHRGTISTLSYVPDYRSCDW